MISLRIVARGSNWGMQRWVDSGRRTQNLTTSCVSKVAFGQAFGFTHALRSLTSSSTGGRKPRTKRAGKRVKLASTVHAVNAANKRTKRAVARAAKLERQVEALQLGISFLKESAGKARHRKHMTTLGRYKMGWKASIGCGGAVTVAAILEVPISRQQVCKCECLLAATVLGLHRQWFSGMYATLDAYLTVASEVANVSKGD